MSSAEGHRPPTGAVTGNVRLPRLDMLDSEREISHREDLYSAASSSSSEGDSSRFSSYPSGPSSYFPRSPVGQLDNYRRSRSPLPGQHHHDRYSRVPALPTASSRSAMMAGSLPPLSSLTPQQSSGHGLLQPDSPHFGQPHTRPNRSASTSFVTGPPNHSFLSASAHSRPSSSTPSPSFHEAVPRFQNSGTNRDDWPPHAHPSQSYYDQQYSPGAETSSAPASSTPASSKRPPKAHVSSACLNCKRAHLACDSERPCRRCSKLGKTATCVDVQHKKRGRPRLKDRDVVGEVLLDAMAPPSSSWQASIREQPPYYPGGSASASAAAHGRQYAWGAPPPPPSGYTHHYGPPTASVPSNEQYASRSRPDSSHESGLTPRQTILLCGNDFVVAHASSDSYEVLGLPPSQVTRRSILDLVHPQDLQRFEHIWRSLLEPVGLSRSYFPPVGMDALHNGSADDLHQPARGTIFLDETIRVHVENNRWASCFIRIHLGGGLGLDLFQPETLSRSYVVCAIGFAETRAPRRASPEGYQVEGPESSFASRIRHLDRTGAHEPPSAARPISTSSSTGDHFKSPADRPTVAFLDVEASTSRSRGAGSAQTADARQDPSVSRPVEKSRYSGLLARKMAAASAAAEDHERSLRHTVTEGRTTDSIALPSNFKSAYDDHVSSAGELREHQKGRYYEAHPSELVGADELNSIEEKEKAQYYQMYPSSELMEAIRDKGYRNRDYTGEASTSQEQGHPRSPAASPEAGPSASSSKARSLVPPLSDSRPSDYERHRHHQHYHQHQEGPRSTQSSSISSLHHRH